MGEENGGGGALIRTGVAHLPLHTGRAPRWLFERMRKLAREIIRVIIYEGGQAGVFKKLSDPFWFQAFGCTLGFDWHSSGLTTTVCGALKEGLRGLERETGIFIGGGKGSASRKTPQEIQEFCEKLGRDAESLVYASKMSAKIDNTAAQDGYPFPVSRGIYDQTINILREQINQAKLEVSEKRDAFRKLACL